MDTNRDSSKGDQRQHLSSSAWPNVNPSLPPIYSSFGLVNPSSYQEEQQQQIKEFSSLFNTSSGNNDQMTDTYNLSSPFYNSLNFSSDSSNRVFNNLSGNNLIDNLNNRLNTSDSINIFSGNSSFSSGQALAGPSETRSRHVASNDQNEASRTYSSVLYSRCSTFQRQQQELIYQTFGNGGGSIGGQQSTFVSPTNNQLEHYLSGTGTGTGTSQQQQQQQDQQRRQYPPYQRAPRQQHPSGVCHSSDIIQPGTFGSTGSRNDNNNTNDKMFSCGNRGALAQVASANKRRNKMPFFAGGTSSNDQLAGFRLDTVGTGVINSEESERFSRKVFVGGLPPDIDEEEIKASFRRFGPLVVDWPHKAESKSYFPPKGYAFLLFQEELSVQSLINSCYQEEDKLYLCVSSPTIKDKPVQIRPWRLNDSDFVLDSTLALDPSKTVFVGGVPRPLKACELATIMNNLYGGVSYAGIDTDPDLKYPKGAGRVAFSNHRSYIAAISARFVHIRQGEIDKRVEVKPFVLDDQFCDECQGSRCNNKFAPFFCANITCLRYLCDNCWTTVHSQAGKEFHKPLVKEGGDRPRGSHQPPLRW